MEIWIIWLVVACLLGLGEMHQGAFYLAPFALGAALAAVVALLGVGAPLSAVVFLACSGIVFGTLRPVARRHRRHAAVDPHRRGGAGRQACARARADRQRGGRRLREDRRRRGVDRAQL